MKIAVIGTGIMGIGIGQVFAQCNEVEKIYLCGTTEERAEKSRIRIQKNIDYLIFKGKIDECEGKEFISKIHIGTKRIAVDADLMIETVIEDLTAKQKLFQELDTICQKSCVFATNTSSLSITAIGAGISRPVVGMHFFNPAPVMELIEVTAGLNTPEETVERILSISRTIGKTPVKVEEAPGLIVNRLLIPMINEAIGIYSEGIASVEDIDTAMKLGANHPIGPLALGDLIGLDVVLAILEILYKETGDNKHCPAPLLRKMVRGMKLGRKTGEGFYKY